MVWKGDGWGKGGGWGNGGWGDGGGSDNVATLRLAMQLMGKGGGSQAEDALALLLGRQMMAGKGKGAWGPSGGYGCGYGKGKGSSQMASAGAKASAGANPGTTWKGRLNEAIMQASKEAVMPKGCIIYTVEEAGAGSFTCFVVSEKLSDAHASKEVQPTKRLAEEAAAMAALHAEFPAVYNLIPKSARKVSAAIPEPGSAAPAGQKRKIEDINSDPKSKLCQGLSIVIGRPLTKADLEYSVEQKGGTIVATVKVNCIDPTQSFRGKPAPGPVTKASQKHAEGFAAAAALKQLQALIDEKMPEFEAKKAAKRAVFTSKMEELRAAGTFDPDHKKKKEVEGGEKKKGKKK